jgi:hypothetical protein
MKFTFKTDKPTGQYRSFYSNHHEIKLNKKVIGSIDPKLPHKIRLQVMKTDIMEDGNPNCKWKWIVLKQQSQTLQETKEFLNRHCDEILQKYNLYLQD